LHAPLGKVSGPIPKEFFEQSGELTKKAVLQPDDDTTPVLVSGERGGKRLVCEEQHQRLVAGKRVLLLTGNTEHSLLAPPDARAYIFFSDGT
jgi:hypothetical protein